MAIASLSLQPALPSFRSNTKSISLPLSSHLPTPPSVGPYKPWRAAAPLRSPPPASVFPKLSAAVIDDEDDPAAEKFSQNNSIADFMRFKRGVAGGEGAELQTAVVSYRKRLPWRLLQPFLQVDLVSTIHIADKEYFEVLQRGLESYDCILYEMVASRESLENRLNSKAPRKLKSSRSKGFNIIGFIQRQMARVLSLDFQLDCLDYELETWQHADLDYEKFKLLQELLHGLRNLTEYVSISSIQDERGESFFTLAKEMTLRSTKAFVQPSMPSGLGPWRSKLLTASRVLPMPLVGLLVISSICSPSESYTSEYSELEALFRLDIGAALKIFLAKRLTSEFTEVTAAIEEKSVIIGERNKVATEVLRRAIDHGNKRIAVLYGGGHMPDLGRRLREDFDMIPYQVQWITAWSIMNRELDSDSFPFLKPLAKFLGWPLDRYQTVALLILSSFLALDLWFWELFFGTAVNFASSAAYEFSLTDTPWIM